MLHIFHLALSIVGVGLFVLFVMIYLEYIIFGVFFSKLLERSDAAVPIPPMIKILPLILHIAFYAWILKKVIAMGFWGSGTVAIKIWTVDGITMVVLLAPIWWLSIAFASKRF